MLGKYDHKEAEKRIAELWKKEKVYAFDEKSKKPVYAIDTPPPTISGKLHIGHLFGLAQHDSMVRYKRMRGFNIFYPVGLDNNGLPTEILVEKEHNVVAEKLGREKFTELVEKTKEKYEEEYKNVFHSLALSVDWSLLYTTMSKDVRIASQLSFIELYKMGRAYRKETPTLWCPKDKTAVSQMELEDKSEKTKFVYIRFDKDVEIATTRPELLPAIVAIMVSPEDKKRAKLVGKTVKVPLFGNEVKIIADQRVDPEKGTGMVMCCTFGDQTDIEWYKAYNLDLRIAIDDSGRMTTEGYKGMKPKEARQKIIEELKKGGFVTKEQEIDHDTKIHERCKHEIEFIVKEQWYIKYLDLKDELLKLGNQLKWHPEYMRHRYDNWVQGLQWDWGISRQRFFGIPFPVWYCKNCSEVKLADRSQLPVNPLADKPKGGCEKCGSTEFIPEPDVLDTWATSSLTPLINAHWATDKKYMDKVYPMSLRTQGHDIITFWLFTTIVKSYLHTKKLPWADAMINGHGLDPQGKPMHKSLGNIIDAVGTLDKYGADSIRYWAASSNLGEEASFQEKDMISAQRLVNKLWNVARFIEQNCKDFKGEPKEIDRWITARSMRTLEEATDMFEDFNYAGAKRAAEEFFWFFSDNYLEFVKYRIYGKDASANATLGRVFLLVLKMMAPFMPFVTEEIYQNLFKGRLDSAVSVHVSEWPEFDKRLVEEKILKEGDRAQKVIEYVRQWKHNNKMALNAELRELVVSDDLGELADDVKGAMNIKQITSGKGSEKVPDTEMSVEIRKS
ncbi:MAG: valine--tRNA ligase [Candidatus Micrarchaeota archaeon]|nr:valine--tRNA ligase [Candidatus Micrarchaeota archaeon]